MATATLTINSRNYGAWSLRGWLLCKFSGIEFEERIVAHDDPDTRAELLMLSSSFRVPRLEFGGFYIWDTLAIGEFLHERFPQAKLLPDDAGMRSHCRSISGEMHAGFANLRAGLPMNIRARYANYPVWAGVQADIDRIVETWEGAFEHWGGQYLVGDTLTMADAMYAPVCTRFRTYDVKLDGRSAEYCARILALPEMLEWERKAMDEPEEMEELDIEF
jgi:glutathione S-transferase